MGELRPRRSRTVAVTIAATLVALAGLTGCGGSSRKKDQKTTSTRARTTTRAQVRLPIATVQDVGDGGSGPEPMVVSIYDLRRNGPFVTLDFGIRCENPSTGCDAGTLFAFVTLREENTAATIKT